jgi:hypothetical protein
LRRPFCLDDADIYDEAMSRAITYQKRLADQSTAALVRWTVAFLRDVAIVKETCHDSDGRTAANFLRFVLATGAMSHCFGTGQMNRFVDWLVLSLSDEFAMGEENLQFRLDLDRLALFMDSPNEALKRNAGRIICQWACFAYGYFSSMNALSGIARDALVLCLAVVSRRYPAPESLGALFAMAYWTIDHDVDRARTVALELETLYSHGPYPHAREIAVALATRLGDFTSRGQIGWIQEVRRRFWDTLSPAERFSIIATEARDPRFFDANRGELFAVIDALRPHAGAAIAAVEQHRERNSRALGPLTLNLVREGRSADAVELLVRWHDVKGASALTNALIFFPFTTVGAVWGYNEHVVTVAHEASTAEKAIGALNSALGTTIVTTPQNPMPERFGTPDEMHGFTLAAATANQLGLPVFDGDGIPEDIACLPLSSSPFPHQATMLARIDKTWPFTVSLLNRKADRAIRRVGIWTSGLVLAEEECRGLQTLFEQSGVDVEIESAGAHDDRDRFLSMYRNQNLDIFWIIGHGNQVAFAPDENSLRVFADNGEITVASLVGESPNGPARRLLVMNVCSGAKPTGYGNGLPRMSMAGLCASDSQAVISHLWPISFHAAYAFGLTLANTVRSGDGFFPSFCRAVRTVQAGNECVAGLLADAGLEDDAARIINAPQLANPICSYSPAFYE